MDRTDPISLFLAKNRPLIYLHSNLHCILPCALFLTRLSQKGERQYNAANSFRFPRTPGQRHVFLVCASCQMLFVYAPHLIFRRFPRATTSAILMICIKIRVSRGAGVGLMLYENRACNVSTHLHLGGDWPLGDNGSILLCSRALIIHRVYISEHQVGENQQHQRNMSFLGPAPVSYFSLISHNVQRNCTCQVASVVKSARNLHVQVYLD